MEVFFLVVAFIFGLLAKGAGLPPLVGYLVAGFALHYLGFETNDTLETIANLGVTLLLFTIGLKLNIRDLTKTEVWASSSLHMIVWTAVMGGVFIGLGSLGLSHFVSIDPKTAFLLAFALSFSSTVCVVKVLEQGGESKTRHGKLALGILVMQDIFAVVALVVLTGNIPSPWALLLLLLIPLTPVINRILNYLGHGELLVLSGFILALGAYELFHVLGIKGDLGALVIGMIMATNPRSHDLAKSMLSFKDVFLVGFFLTIGLQTLPDIGMVLIALMLCVFLLFKFVLFFALYTGFKLRIRTAYLTSLVTGNYSEFGLIVGALAVNLGILSPQWLVIIALSLSFSFVLTSVLYPRSHSHYARIKEDLRRFESTTRLAEDVYPDLQDGRILVVGLGRVGQVAFNTLQQMENTRVWGMDADRRKVRRLQKEGMRVITGDGEDIDFWENINVRELQLVMLALPTIDDAINVREQLSSVGYKGKMVAIARHEEEVEPLREVGIDKVLNYFTEAGSHFAEESLEMLEPVKPEVRG